MNFKNLINDLKKLENLGSNIDIIKNLINNLNLLESIEFNFKDIKKLIKYLENINDVDVNKGYKLVPAQRKYNTKNTIELTLEIEIDDVYNFSIKELNKCIDEQFPNLLKNKIIGIKN